MSYTFIKKKLYDSHDIDNMMTILASSDEICGYYTSLVSKEEANSMDLGALLGAVKVTYCEYFEHFDSEVSEKFIYYFVKAWNTYNKGKKSVKYSSPSLLRYNNAIVGVRVKSDNTYVDMDIDTAKKFNIPVQNSKRMISLISSNGSIMSQEELDSGHCYKNVSNSPSVLNEIARQLRG